MHVISLVHLENPCLIHTTLKKTTHHASYIDGMELIFATLQSIQHTMQRIASNDEMSDAIIVIQTMMTLAL